MDTQTNPQYTKKKAITLFKENLELHERVEALSSELKYNQELLRLHKIVVDDILEKQQNQPFAPELSNKLVDYISNKLDAEIVSILINERGVLDEKVTTIQAAVGIDEKIIQDTRKDIEEGISGLVMQKRQMLHLDSIEASKLSSNKNKYTTDCIAIPIFYNYGEPMGIIAVTNKSKQKGFDMRDEFLLRTIAQISSLVLSNAIGREKELLSYCKVVELKDNYTFSHSDRVRQYSLLLAEALKLKPSILNELGRYSILHDTGKIGVPESVLNKPNKLTDKEFATIKKHPYDGYRILEPLKVASEYAWHHHERWDGNGYPDRLAGEQIPIAIRVLSVADVFDAITANRPYRKGMPSERAIQIIKEETGKQFWPDAAKAFYDLCNNGQRLKIEQIMATGRNN